MRLFGVVALLASVGLGFALARNCRQHEFFLEAETDGDWTWKGGEYLDVGGPRAEIVRSLKAGDKVRYVWALNDLLEIECEVYQITRGRQFGQYTYGVVAYYGMLGGIIAAPLLAWLVAFIVVEARKRPRTAP